MEYKVSIIQFQPELGDTSANIRTLEQLFPATDGSSLVILPELANAGYNFKDRDEAFAHAEILDGQGRFQEFLLHESARRNVHIVAGINEKDGNSLYNSAILAGPGGLMGKYRKMHLFMNEKDIFQPGDAGLPVFDIGGFKIGILICFDYLFPEPWRIMAQNGADLICHPSNLLTENPRRCVPGLALMNRIYIATANRFGTERGITFNGCSFFTGPDGIISGMASPDRAEVMDCVIDTEKSRNKMITARNHVFEDRRPEMYAG
jgi:predicted amidohydrolase